MDADDDEQVPRNYLQAEAEQSAQSTTQDSSHPTEDSATIQPGTAATATDLALEQDA